MPRRPAVLAVALAAALTTPLLASPAQAAPSRAKLVRFDSCQDLTAFARDRLVQTGGTTGVPFRGDVVVTPPLVEAGIRPGAREVATAQPVAAPAPQAEQDGAAGAAGDTAFSTTNNQEAGVDEADLVKTDGRRLYVVHDAVLRIFDVTDPVAPPRQIAKLTLQGSEHQLLLRGPRLLAIGTTTPQMATEVGVGAPSPPAGRDIAPEPPAERKVLLTEIDVTDPAAPKIARTMELAGTLAGARLTGGAARIVVASTPQPIQAPFTEAQLKARAARVKTSSFVPSTTIRSRITRKTYRRSVVPCRRVRHPRQFSGLDLLTVLTIDLDQGLMNVNRDAVMAGAQDVYASPTALVVASRRYDAPETGGVTDLHLFAAGAEPRTAYQGSGSVPGYLLNQFSMSEHEGALRVATTEDPPWDPATGAQTGESQSGVTVLRPQDGRLATVGRVTGLGKGERIYAVRFLGERGYVVTFRQVDPLYALDLSDDTKPRVTGELKIAGYSAYLHPISDTLLLGVGQDATEQGRRLGPQVSLFDVGDPAAPKLVTRASLGQDGSAAAEQDHHAFLWWAPARLAVLPVDTYGGETPFSGAVGYRVTAEAVQEVGRIAHPAPGEDRSAPPIGRSVVVGDRLLTLSSVGIAVNGVADLAPRAFSPLG